MGKERVSTDPQNTHWSKDTSRFGFQMLEKMGWAKGKGLGKEETGVQTHVVVKKREDNVGLGADRSTHFDWRVHMTNLDSVLKGLKGNASPKGSDSGGEESQKAKEKRERKEQRKKRKLAEREAEEAAAKSAGEASEGEASPRKKQKTTMLEGGIEVVAPTGKRRNKTQSSYALPSADTPDDDPYATHAFKGFST